MAHRSQMILTRISLSMSMSDICIPTLITQEFESIIHQGKKEMGIGIPSFNDLNNSQIVHLKDTWSKLLWLGMLNSNHTQLNYYLNCKYNSLESNWTVK